MVEQVQATPPYEAIPSLGVASADPNTISNHHATHPGNTGAPAKVHDTVTLSDSAQASQLYLQGNTVTQIAALLGLPTATVDSVLNITASNSTTAQKLQAPLATPQAQVAPTDATVTASTAGAPYTAPSHSSEKPA